MLPDDTGKPPIAENETPKKAEIEPAQGEAPLTQEEYAIQLQRLIERGRAAGLQPLKTMAQSYGGRLMAGLERFVASLEGNDNPKKKEK